MSVSTVVEQLYSIEKAVRMLAIRSLGEIGAGAAIAIPDLLELVDDADRDIAALALRALPIIGPNESLKPKVVETLGDPCPRMRQMAALAIGAMGEIGRDVVPTLAAMLED